jgi:hypothetical protein
MVFVGYEAGTKGYRAYDPLIGQVHITRDAVFDELTQWDWREDAGVCDDINSFEFTVTTTTTVQELGVLQEMPTPTGGAQTPTPPPAPKGVMFVSSPNVELDLDADHDVQAPLRFHRLDNVLGPTTVLGQAERVFHEELHMVSAEGPTSLEEAAHDPSWLATMVEELH